MPKFSERIDALYTRAHEDRDAFVPPGDPPDEAQAMAYLQDGVGQAVAVYVDARSGEWTRFDKRDFQRLEAAMNTWLELYARCYGHEIEADFTVREAAEAFVDTHNIHDVARILTHIPARSETPADT